MSRQNKVNPGMYTQRGRLTQDDAARELREAALGRIAAHVAAVEEGSRCRGCESKDDAADGDGDD